MSSYYDTMQVCQKWGHKITDRYDKYPNYRQDHCEKCGSETVIACEFCKTRIKGYLHFENAIGVSQSNVPLYCHKCGKPYPWRNVLFVENLIKTLVSPLKYVFDSVISIFKKII